MRSFGRSEDCRWHLRRRRRRRRRRRFRPRHRRRLRRRHRQGSEHGKGEHGKGSDSSWPIGVHLFSSGNDKNDECVPPAVLELARQYLAKHEKDSIRRS